MAPNSSRKPTPRFLRHRFLPSVHVGQIPAWNLMRAFAFLEQLVVLKGARALPLSRISRVIVYSYKLSAPYANPHSANSRWLPRHYWWLVFQHDCSETPRRSIYCLQKPTTSVQSHTKASAFATLTSRALITKRAMRWIWCPHICRGLRQRAEPFPFTGGFSA